MASFYTKIVGASFSVSHSTDHTVNGLKMTNTFLGLYLYASNYLTLDGDQLVQPKVGSTNLIAMYPTELTGTLIVPRFNKSAQCEVWLRPIEFPPPPPKSFNSMPIIVVACVLVGVVIPLVVGIICLRRYNSSDSELVPTQDFSSSSLFDSKEEGIELQPVSSSPLLEEEEAL
eukprot:TRINITY_DN7388_c0_g1_i1.p2 TRINITY_DN7388_c0_g1~~TRINITY_DN7388_c0_g1_i1.p2  ORF type:complete len:173 (-),score=36.22 TRINITY_DN7388_c0_g1_i1:158-676(-)